jgi:8-oxo-dGTP diphosphatase
MRGLILFIAAKLLMTIVYPLGFLWSIGLTLFKNGWKSVDTYLFNCAIADDQHGNTYVAKLFNDVLIKVGGYRFGNPDETISSVLGKNKLTNTLTILGRGLDWILEKLDPNHSIKSIETVDTKKNIV